MHFIHECVNWICFSVPGSNSFFFHKSSSVVNTAWSVKQFFYDYLQTSWQTIGYSTQLQRDCESRRTLWTWEKNLSDSLAAVVGWHFLRHLPPPCKADTLRFTAVSVSLAAGFWVFYLLGSGRDLPVVLDKDKDAAERRSRASHCVSSSIVGILISIHFKLTSVIYTLKG